MVLRCRTCGDCSYSWSDANAECVKLHPEARLASVHNFVENDVIYKMASDQSPVDGDSWIGIFRSTQSKFPLSVCQSVCLYICIYVRMYVRVCFTLPPTQLGSLPGMTARRWNTPTSHLENPGSRSRRRTVFISPCLPTRPCGSHLPAPPLTATSAKWKNVRAIVQIYWLLSYLKGTGTLTRDIAVQCIFRCI